MEPRFWRLEDGGVYRCELCFHGCRLVGGAMGYCGVRGVDENRFVSPYLGRFTSASVDPIEKKPLYYWRPGTFIFSLGSLGCTMRCPFCQNHAIAQPESRVDLVALPVEDLISKIRELGLASVAYTYNEPTLQAEYILQAAPQLREAGVATVLVTNGLFSKTLANELNPLTAAANVDLKTFNPAAYAAMGGSLEVVKNNISLMARGGVHVEVTTLVVPGLSDDQDEFAAMVDWLADLSPEIPYHLSRYFPAHKYSAPPTDIGLLRRFQQTAEARLRHVHLGNVR